MIRIGTEISVAKRCRCNAMPDYISWHWQSLKSQLLSLSETMSLSLVRQFPASQRGNRQEVVSPDLLASCCHQLGERLRVHADGERCMQVVEGAWKGTSCQGERRGAWEDAQWFLRGTLVYLRGRERGYRGHVGVCQKCYTGRVQRRSIVQGCKGSAMWVGKNVWGYSAVLGGCAGVYKWLVQDEHRWAGDDEQRGILMLKLAVFTAGFSFDFSGEGSREYCKW